MYEIKILSNEDFDTMAKSDPRYKFVDENNLGFADRAKGVAYVRQTHIHDLNKYLVTHELEELEKDGSTHEDAYGIRHKKFFKDFLMPIFSGFLGGSSSGGSAGGILGGVSSGLGSLFGSKSSSGSYTPTTSGNYSPLNSFAGTGASGAGTLPSAFSGTYSPTITSGGITDQNALDQLPPEVRERMSGNYSGRLTF